jgi:hypothetical protein
MTLASNVRLAVDKMIYNMCVRLISGIRCFQFQVETLWNWEVAA